MSSADRKRRIREHLIQSSGGKSFLPTEKNTRRTPTTVTQPATPLEPEPVTPPPPPVPTQGEERKRRIQSHVKLSSDNFGDFSLEDKEKKRKVMNHIRKSLN